MQVKIIIIALFFAVFGCLQAIPKSAVARSPVQADTLHNIKLASSHFKIVAHRGNAAEYPENTLTAFDSAVSLSDVIAFEYRLSADGVPMVVSDETLDRTTTADEILDVSNLKVSALTALEIQSYDAGGWYSPAYYGESVPTVLDVLERFSHQKTLMIDHKIGDAASLVELLKKAHVNHHVIVQSADLVFLRDMMILMPSIQTVLLKDDNVFSEQQIVALRTVGVKTVNIPHKSLIKSKVRQLHKKHIDVWAYGAHDRRSMEAALELGVDALVTNAPRVAAELRSDLNIKVNQTLSSH
jgi:glycerophosphoryl diester phosphodiesterase